MAGFDVEAAKKAGYSEDEIRQFLLGSSGAQAAKKAGYSDQEILDHFGLSASAPAPAPSLGEQVNREASIAGGGLVKGIAAAAALPSTLSHAADWLERKAAGALGLPVASPEEAQASRTSGPIGQLSAALDLPSMATTQGAVNALGLAGPTPETMGERFLSAGAQGVGAALATPLGSGSQLLNAVTGATSGLGAQAGTEAFPESTLAPIIGGLVGGTLGGGLVSDIAGSAKASDAVKAAGADVAQAAKTSDIVKGGLEDLQQQKAALSVAKREMTLQQQKDLDAALAAHKTTTGALASDAEQKIAQATAPAQATIDSTAKTLGPSETLQQAGETLQSAARNWLTKTFPQKKEEIWAPVDAQIPDATQTPLFGFKAALNDINKDAGVLTPLTDLLKPSIPSRLAKALDLDVGTAAGKPAQPAVMGQSTLLDASGNPIAKVVKPAEPGQPVTWADARRLRTVIGDAMGNPMTVRDIGEQNLAHMYAALTGDLRSAASEVGPDALQAFDDANVATTKLFDVAQGPVAKLVASGKKSADDPNPENVASSLLAGGKKGASDLAVLRNEMPDAVNDLGAVALKQGRWSGLSPEARQQLVADANARQAVDSAHSTIETASDVANAARDAGVAASQARVDALQASQKAERQAHAQQVIGINDDLNAARGTASGVRGEQEAAQARLAEAEAAKAKLAGRWTVPGHLGVLGGSYLGEHLAAPLINSLGLTVSEPTLAIAGGAVPFGLMLARNPALRGAAAQSDVIGNTLALPQPK